MGLRITEKILRLLYGFQMLFAGDAAHIFFSLSGLIYVSEQESKSRGREQ